jgi:anaerobic selenocysteine-containing dehydrogenase
VELHPVAAEARGLANGEWVSIETPEGMVRARARLNDDLDSRVVVGEHGWWHSTLANQHFRGPVQAMGAVPCF